MNPFLIGDVLARELCIGCGACTALSGSQGVRLTSTRDGRFVVNTAPGDPSASLVCPFADPGPHENEIGEELFAPLELNHRRSTGFFHDVYAGHVAEPSFRQRGSSGGFTSWLLKALLERGLVDAVIHVKPSKGPGPLYQYAVSDSVSELQKGSKSHYYPVEMSGVLEEIRRSARRYAVVGVPCFIKALRRLARTEPVFKERIHFHVGLFCGHLKGSGFAEFLAHQAGIEPHELTGFDFRTKQSEGPASRYAITAFGRKDGQPIQETKPTTELLGTDWGMAFFKYKACDYCDDISAELADVGVGDAWLPEYVHDSQGTNIVVVRNKVIGKLVSEGIAQGELNFSVIAPEKVDQSQAANVRHRLEDIGYRLARDRRQGLAIPKKREAPQEEITQERRAIQEIRLKIRDELPTAWTRHKEAGSLDAFTDQARRWTSEYKAVYASFRRKPPTLFKRVLNKLKRLLRK